MVIDCHVHLMCLPGETQAQGLARLLRCMDRLGIDQACVFLGDRLIFQPTADELVEQNRWAASTVDLAPDRLIGFVYASPNHPQISLELMGEYLQGGGFRGVKLWVCQRADHPGNDPICREAERHRAPLLAHAWHKVAGNLAGESGPEHVVALARRHPGVSFIMAHAGGDWERGLRAIREQTNILTDTSGNDPEAGFTEMAVSLLGPERVVFGSDATGRSIASQLAKVTGARIDEEARRRVLGGNMMRMLGR